MCLEGGGGSRLGIVKTELAALLWYQVYFENMQTLRGQVNTNTYKDSHTLVHYLLKNQKMNSRQYCCMSGRTALHTPAFYVVFKLCKLMKQTSIHLIQYVVMWICTLKSSGRSNLLVLRKLRM